MGEARTRCDRGSSKNKILADVMGNGKCRIDAGWVKRSRQRKEAAGCKLTHVVNDVDDIKMALFRAA